MLFAKKSKSKKSTTTLFYLPSPLEMKYIGRKKRSEKVDLRKLMQGARLIRLGNAQYKGIAEEMEIRR